MRHTAPLAAILLGLAAFAAPPAGASHPGDAALLLYDGGRAQVRFVGLLQLQATPWVGGDSFLLNGDPAESPGARIRRARIGIAGSAWGDTDYELSLQAVPGGVELLDAWVGYRGLTSITFYGGARKVPYSRFALSGAGESALIDRPLAVRAMAPFRQVGLTIEGDIGEGLVRWAVGVYNGFTRNPSFHAGYGEATALEGNRFTNLAYVARVDLSPFGPIGTTLADLDHGGFYGALGASFYFDDGETVETLGFEVDLHIKTGGFHFAAELLWDSAEPATQPTTGATIPGPISRLAAVAELGYMILPAQLGVTLRGEYLDDNADQDNGGDSIVVTGGLQYYFRRHNLKAGLEFTHREELHGSALDNDSLLFQLQFQL